MAKEVNTTQDVGVGECGWWLLVGGVAKRKSSQRETLCKTVMPTKHAKDIQKKFVTEM